MKKIEKNRKIKIVWLSANIFGYELLKEAVKKRKGNIIAILTLSKNSKTKMYDGIEKKKWKEFAIPVFEIKEINKEIQLLRSLKPDFIIMAGWRQMIGREIIDLPLRGFVGFHPALLPKGRGPAPIINSILSGVKESGVTMFYANEGVDSGDIIGQAKFKIADKDYAKDVYNKVIEGGKRLINKFLPPLIKGNAPRIPQNGRKATFFPKINMKENEIKLNNDSPEKIIKKIRAFSCPYKGAYFKVKNKKIIIWKAKLENEKKD